MVKILRINYIRRVLKKRQYGENSHIRRLSVKKR